MDKNEKFVREVYPDAYLFENQREVKIFSQTPNDFSSNEYLLAFAFFSYGYDARDRAWKYAAKCVNVLLDTMVKKLES